MTHKPEETRPESMFAARTIWFRNNGGGLIGVGTDGTVNNFSGVQWCCGLCLEVVAYVDERRNADEACAEHAKKHLLPAKTLG